MSTKIQKISLDDGTTAYDIIPYGIQTDSHYAKCPTLSADTTLEVQDNKTLTISSSSTNAQYPTARAVLKKILDLYGFNFTAYQPVSYIQSTGTQWINSNALIKANTRVKAGIIFSSAFEYNMMYGNWNSFAFSLIATNVICAASGGVSSQNTYLSCSAGELCHITQEPGTITLESPSEITRSVSFGGSSNDASNTPIFIFAAGAGGTSPYSWSSYGQGKLYYLKIYEGTALTNWFIPCYRKSDSVIGLFDLVNGVFRTNQGSGVFTKGNDISF